MGLVRRIKTTKDSIVLTTSVDSKGVDFLFAVQQAYVIHLALPKSLVNLKQDFGRGTRGSDLPVVGALITSEKYTDIKDVELGVTFAEQFDSLYPFDYSISLNHLKVCSSSN
jgi:hypothetical protein